MKSKILSLLALSDVVLLANPVEVKTVPTNGQPDHQVVSLSWKDADCCKCGTLLTEEGLANASFDEKTQSIQVSDFEGDKVLLQLVAKGAPLTAEVAPPPPEEAKVYVLIQEGGSSAELYLHAHHTFEDAEDDRESCADNGAYRTSSTIVEVPASLANHPAFYEIAEKLLGAVSTLGFPGHE